VRAGREEWVAGLKEAFPDDHTAIDAYLADLDAFKKTPLLYAIWRSLTPGGWLAGLLRPLMAAPALPYFADTAAAKLDKLTSNKRLRAVLGYVSLGCCGTLPEEISYGAMLGLHAHFMGGASYPVGGSSAIARGLVETIEAQGGLVLVGKAVDRILVRTDSNGGRVVSGVRLAKNGIEIHAPVVISTVGLRETLEGPLRAPGDVGPGHFGSCYSGLAVGRDVDGADFIDPLQRDQREKLTQRLAALPHGRGHILAFVGLKDDDGTLRLPKRNCWLLPGYDLKESMETFWKGVEAVDDEIPPFGYVGLGFPSEKDPSYRDRHDSGKTAAFVCGDIPWEWFRQWFDTRAHKRGDSYEMLKERLGQRLLEAMYKKYPQLRGRVEYFDIGTPLSTNTYLGRLTGSSYGIPPTVAKAKADAEWIRPVMPDVLPPGLFLAGQDITVDGFAPALLSSLMCMAAIDGPLAWLRLVPMLGGVVGTIRVLMKG
jgi:all-trans-retinol 13,14-reductase